MVKISYPKYMYLFSICLITSTLSLRGIWPLNWGGDEMPDPHGKSTTFFVPIKDNEKEGKEASYSKHNVLRTYGHIYDNTRLKESFNEDGSPKGPASRIRSHSGTLSKLLYCASITVPVVTFLVPFISYSTQKRNWDRPNPTYKSKYDEVNSVLTTMAFLFGGHWCGKKRAEYHRERRAYLAGRNLSGLGYLPEGLIPGFVRKVSTPDSSENTKTYPLNPGTCANYTFLLSETSPKPEGVPLMHNQLPLWPNDFHHSEIILATHIPQLVDKHTPRNSMAMNDEAINGILDGVLGKPEAQSRPRVKNQGKKKSEPKQRAQGYEHYESSAHQASVEGFFRGERTPSIQWNKHPGRHIFNGVEVSKDELSPIGPWANYGTHRESQQK